MSSLQQSIENLASGGVTSNLSARQTFLEFRDALTSGKIRAAEKLNGKWTVNAWVKQGILLGFKLGELQEMGARMGCHLWIKTLSLPGIFPSLIECAWCLAGLRCEVELTSRHP